MKINKTRFVTFNIGPHRCLTKQPQTFDINLEQLQDYVNNKTDSLSSCKIILSFKSTKINYESASLIKVAVNLYEVISMW